MSFTRMYLSWTAAWAVATIMLPSLALGQCANNCCPPVIEKPCDTTVHYYQRTPSVIGEPECEEPDYFSPDYEPPEPYQPPACPSWSSDPCELAQLIYTVMTDCHAKDRKAAVDTLGDDYSCKCDPIILVALVYALNDTDHKVRREAANELGDQMSDHPCCCCREVVVALKCALGDCDAGVRKEAEKALEACGFCVVDGRCEEECTCPSWTAYGCGEHIAPVPAEGAPADAAPTPNGEAAPTPPGDLPMTRIQMIPPQNGNDSQPLVMPPNSVPVYAHQAQKRRSLFDIFKRR